MGVRTPRSAAARPRLCAYRWTGERGERTSDWEAEETSARGSALNGTPRKQTQRTVSLCRRGTGNTTTGSVFGTAERGGTVSQFIPFIINTCRVAYSSLSGVWRETTGLPGWVGCLEEITGLFPAFNQERKHAGQDVVEPRTFRYINELARSSWREQAGAGFLCQTRADRVCCFKIPGWITVTYRRVYCYSL